MNKPKVFRDPSRPQSRNWDDPSLPQEFRDPPRPRGRNGDCSLPREFRAPPLAEPMEFSEEAINIIIIRQVLGD